MLCWQLHSFMQLLGHQNATYLEAGLAAALLVMLPFVAPSQVGALSCLADSPCLDLLPNLAHNQGLDLLPSTTQGEPQP